MITKEKEKDMLYTACGTPNYVAPEIINGKGYQSKVDCWSLGVILYVMLCGFPPFYDEDNEKLFSLIQDAQFDFPSPYWDTISENAKELIRKLLVKDPSKRLSANEILNHPWLTGTNSENQLKFQTHEYQKYKSIRLVNNILIFRNMRLWQL